MENEPERSEPTEPAVSTGVEDEEGGPVKTFLEHLEDLRWVLIRLVAALLVGFMACLAGGPYVVDFLSWPLVISNAPIKIQSFGPMGAFIISMKIALYGGLTVSLPFLLYFIGQYIMPALKRNEKTFFLRAFIVGGGLFLLGLMTCYFFILPMTLKATFQYTAWMHLETDYWRAEEYFQFVILFMVGMGLSFELPILLLSLVKLGLLSYKTLSKGRPYVLLILFAVVSFITPDFVSTFFIMAPLVVLMEICIWIAWWWHRQEIKRLRAGSGTDA